MTTRSARPDKRRAATVFATVAIVISSLAAVPALTARASDDKEKDPRPWVEELQSDDPVARETALHELVSIGRPSLRALWNLLHGPIDARTRIQARRAYSAILGVSPERAVELDERMASVQADPEILGEAAAWIVGLGEGAVHYVTNRDHDDHVLKDLSRRVRVVRAVRHLAAGDNRHDLAARTLGRMGEAVLPHLMDVALDEAETLTVQSQAAERLFSLGGAQVQDDALSLAWAGSTEVRELAAVHLCETAPGDAFLLTADVVVDSDSPRALAALDRYAERVPSSVLRTGLRDDAPEVRALCARAAGSRRDDGARVALLNLLDDPDHDVIAGAVLALGRIGEGDDRAPASKILAHHSPAVRRAAVDALGLIEGEASVQWIAAALSDPDASVRVRAARCLAEREDEDAVDPLLAALDDTNSAVLAAATTALTRITNESLQTISAVSTAEQQRASRDAWRDWGASRSDSDAEKDEEKDGEDAEDARELAPEGARILRELEGVLRREFRAYGKLRDANGTDGKKLLDAALDRMKAVITREKDEDGAPALEISDRRRAVLRHVLTRSSFQSAGELARRVGALPIRLSERDYILLVYEAADAMVRSLGDRFTRLSLLQDASGEVKEDALPALFGKGKSNGLMVDVSEQGATVEFLYAFSSAHRAGLRRGDRIIAMNGELVAAMNEGRPKTLLRDEVDLLVMRDGWTRPVRFHLEPRADDPDEVVVSGVLPGRIGYVRLRAFEPGCAQRIEWALRELETQGIDGLVFDLRYNPGGTVVDAAAIVDKFVPSGEIISTDWYNTPGDKDHREEIIRSTDSDTDRDYPVAVLINKCSASASEMTSGALQDLSRATIVGRTSFGKGIGQNGGMGVRGFTRPSLLGDSAHQLGLSVTVLEYFLPTGRSIQDVGVEPDIEVAEVSYVGERYELIQRIRGDQRVVDYVEALAAEDATLAEQLARYDAWDISEWPGLADLDRTLNIELAPDLVRHAVRMALRDHLVESGKHLLPVDVQEDEYVRTAIAAIAESMGLDLLDVPEYEDLAP